MSGVMGSEVEQDPDPAFQAAIEDWRNRAPEPPSGREGLAEALLAASFAVAASALVLWLPAVHPDPSLPLAAALVVAYVLASRVEFCVGGGYTVPTQLVFIPMLFALPPGQVPLYVALGIFASHLPEYVRHRRHGLRAVSALADSWHAVGPALVIGLAQVARPSWDAWPVLVGALAAQIACDAAATTLRQWVGCGVAPRVQLPMLRWTYLVDVLLSPVGLAAALASRSERYAFLLVVPLVALLDVFARERTARIDHALELGRAYRGTALLLGDVVEADDAYTGDHSRDVVDLAVAVGRRMGLTPREAQRLELGALLHDVGKIVVPKEIINKRGPLTPEEWAVMHRHTIAGQELLERVGGVLSEVGEVVRASHEHFDGRGYPDGIAGDAIPLPARIVTCCDAFSAMTTNRSYRAAMPLSEALAELRRGAGRQFDHDVVGALLGVVQGPVQRIRAPRRRGAASRGLVPAR
jgi:HD-GYP domain-containing protein (c-di-GMP phosphodiesterase class II)